MKRVLFCLSDFRQGGIPRCLQSLLEQLDTTKVKADVLCLYQDGPYKGNLKNCTVLPEDYIVSRLMVHTKKITLGNFLRHIPAIILKCFRAIINRLFNKDLLTIKLHRIAKKCKAYDVAIAYAEGFPAQVVENIVCRRKLIWIHNDYSWDNAKLESSDTNFSVFDKIVCCSEVARQSWIKCYPNMTDKTKTIHNIINAEYIKQQAEHPISDTNFNSDQFTIISIGRICSVKRFDIIPFIAAELKKSGCSFLWYIIGGGPDKEVEHVRKTIHKNNVHDCVILLGERDNPYPYLKRANLFALTSCYECYPTVINEALVLNIPIISNDIPSVREMLCGKKAIITPSENMPSHIVDMINRKIEQKDSYRVDFFRNHNLSIMHEFYSLLK